MTAPLSPEAMREKVAGAIFDTFFGGSSGLDALAAGIAFTHADAALSALGLSWQQVADLNAGRSVVVPKEPTPDMRIAGGIAWSEALPEAETYADTADACYKAMLAAAPKPANITINADGTISPKPPESCPGGEIVGLRRNGNLAWCGWADNVTKCRKCSFRHPGDAT